MRSPNQHLFQRIRTTHTTILNGIGYLFVCARIHECEMSRKTLCKAVCGYGLWPMHPVMSEFYFFIGVPVASDDLHCTRAHCVRWLIARWPITTIIAACASNTQNCRHNRLSNQCMHSSAVAQSKPTKHWTTQIDRHTHIVRRPNCLVICQGIEEQRQLLAANAGCEGKKTVRATRPDPKWLHSLNEIMDLCITYNGHCVEWNASRHDNPSNRMRAHIVCNKCMGHVRSIR